MKDAILDAVKILADFLPDKLFDAHAHIIDSSIMPDLAGVYPYEKAGVDEYKQLFSEWLTKEKTLRLNMIPYPEKHLKEDIFYHNASRLFDRT